MIYPRETIRVESCLAITSRKRESAGTAITKNIYTIVRYEGEDWRAHRLSYNLNVGGIPKCPAIRKEGLVLHTCDNKWCVKPDHLYLGTQSQNMQDKAQRDMAWRAKMSVANIGKRHSQETKNKLRAANLGKRLSEETKRKIGLASLGNKNRLGTEQSIEERTKRADSNRGQKRSPEQRENIRRSVKMWWDKRKSA